MNGKSFKISPLFILLLGILAVHVYGNLYNKIYCQANFVAAEPPKVTLQQGSVKNSTIYMNNTSAEVSVTTPIPTMLTYFPNSYHVVTGTHLSGSIPTSVQTVDSDYFIVRSSATGTSTTAYNPWGYNLFGSTKFVSGTLNSLQSDDATYMTFRSYVIATSTATKTDAFIAYRSNTGTHTFSSPKNRAWDGDINAWNDEVEMATAGSPVRFARVAVCPKNERALEKIVVTLSDDGYLDAYVFDGTDWTVTNDIGRVWTTAPTAANRPYDIAYESLSGEALLVYGTTVAGGTNDLAYRTWSPFTGWGQEMYFDDQGHASKITVTFVALASGLNSDKIGMIYIDGTNSDANAVVWNGSSWDSFIEITGSVSITTEECIAIACESLSGAFMAVAGEGQFVKWTRFTTSWSPVGIFDINSAATSAMNWLKLASSQGNRLMLTSVDGASDLCTAVWDEGLYGNRQWSTASSSIGSLTASSHIAALRFTAQASKSVTNILVYIHTVAASPAYRFGIETSDASYLPSGTYVGGTTNYAVHTPTATGWLNLTLPSTATLTAGTVYHITVRYNSGTIGTSNYTALRRMGTISNRFRVLENKIDPWLNTLFFTTSWSIQNFDPIFVLQYNDGTYESMPYDTAAAHNIFGANWFSQKWSQSTNQIITGVNVPLVKTGTPPDNLYIVLRNETDAQDVATMTIPQADSDTSLQWYERYFDSPIQLMSGKTYRLILRSPSSTSTNYFTCRSLSTSLPGELTFDGTNSVYSFSTNSGSGWTDMTTRDLTFMLLGNGTIMENWVVHTPHDTAVDTHAQRCADFAWEYWSSPKYRNQGLLVYGTTAEQITWRRFRAPTFFTPITNVIMGAYIHPWVQLKSNPRDITEDVKILGAVLEGTVFRLGSISWNGSAFTVIGTSTYTASTSAATFECFELEFSLFGDPTEFEVELEFTGTSNTGNWTQLVWTVDSSFTTESVHVTLQLYNYNIGQYPTSGYGYINATIGTMDLTLTQTIIVDPTHFKDEDGDWKIKLKGVKATSTPFDLNVDLVKFEPTYHSEYTASTEFLFTSLPENTPTQLNLTIVSHYNISSVNVTIQVWNYSSSTYVTGGEGYLTYTSAGANETKLLTINVDPQFYVSDGSCKIKVTGMLAAQTQYQQEINLIKLDYKYNTASTYDYVLKVVNRVSDAWNISLIVYNSINIERLSNCTIYFYDGMGISRQICIINGEYVQQIGAWYNLTGTSTIYIAMKITANSSGKSYIYTHLKVLVPNTSTYNLMIIAFEIS